MADVSYVVEAILSVKNASAFKTDMGQASQHASSLGHSFTSAASSIGDAAISAGLFAAKVAVLGAGAAVAGVAAMGMAIGGTMKSLEDQSIKLGATVAASMSIGFKDAQQSSKDLFNQFRTDAVTSAGETKDFVTIAGLVAGPILGAGKSMEQLHGFTKGAMNLIAGTLGPSTENFRQGGADLMRMLQGNAGVELPLFRQLTALKSLGIESAAVFNKLTVEERYKKITAAMNNPAFKEAAEQAGDSFTGLSSTIKDQLSAMGTAVGGRPYEMVKDAMRRFTKALMPHLDPSTGGLTNYLGTVGQMIESKLVRSAQNLAPIFPGIVDSVYGLLGVLVKVSDFALSGIVSATAWIGDNWAQIRDTARDIWGYLVKAVDAMRTLGSGSLLQGVERYFIIAGALKGVGSAGGMANSIAMATIASKMGGAGAGAAGAEGAAGAGASAAGAAGGVSFGSALAGIGAVILLVSAAVTTVKQNVLGVGDYIAARFAGIKETFYDIGDAAVDLWASLGRLYDVFAVIWGFPIAGYFSALLTVLEVVLVVVNGLVNGLYFLSEGILFLKHKIVGLATDGVEWLITSIDKLGEALDKSYQATEALWDPLTKLADAGAYLTDKMSDAANAIVRFVESTLNVLDLTLKSKGKSSETEDGPTKRYESDKVMSDIGFIAANDGLMKGLNPAKAKATPAKGAGQKVEVVLKVDLGTGQEDALLIRSTRELRKAFEKAQIEQKLSTASMPGVPA